MLDDVKRKLHEEVQQLNHELNVTLPETLERALAMGDLRENGDYQAAIERQGFVQARLNHLRSRLAKLSSIDTSKIPTDRIGLGSHVAVEDVDSGEIEKYELVIPDAAEFDGGQISVGSPLGRVLLDRKPGETVEVRLPAVTRRLKIRDVATIHDQVGR